MPNIKQNQISNRRLTGSYYTLDSIADYLARWAIHDKNAVLLEPSFGDGIFINAAIKQYSLMGAENPEIYGVELQETPYNSYTNKHPSINTFLSDYMDFLPNKKVNAIIGNPPYVSLKNLKSKDREKTINLMSEYGVEMLKSGSLWMPFVIHSAELLKKGGRLGFVLPYEITYVRYAFPLWNYLADHFGKVSIYRIYNDFFPEVDVETIIFLAEDKDGTTDSVVYKTFNSIPDLFVENAIVDTNIQIENILNMDKPFEEKLLSTYTNNLISKLHSSQTLGMLIDECKFKIGYVCGDKNYFHPSDTDIKTFHISKESLMPCLRNSKDINRQKNVGIDLGKNIKYDYLFCPKTISEGDTSYILHGETLGVNQRYKCKIRNPWYVTPNIEVSDVVLTVFGDIPRLMYNSGKYIVTNSLLNGFIHQSSSPKNIICRWYNSLTLLLIELKIHSLGGGTLVFIPGEMDKMEILYPIQEQQTEIIFNKLNTCMISQGIEEAYKLGDEIVLKNIYGFSDNDINEIRNSLNVLRQWRRPESRRRR